MSGSWSSLCLYAEQGSGPVQKTNSKTGTQMKTKIYYSLKTKLKFNRSEQIH